MNKKKIFLLLSTLIILNSNIKSCSIPNRYQAYNKYEDHEKIKQADKYFLNEYKKEDYVEIIDLYHKDKSRTTHLFGSVCSEEKYEITVKYKNHNIDIQTDKETFEKIAKIQNREMKCRFLIKEYKEEIIYIEILEFNL